jgi:hypothetical protein
MKQTLTAHGVAKALHEIAKRVCTDPKDELEKINNVLLELVMLDGMSEASDANVSCMEQKRRAEQRSFVQSLADELDIMLNGK